MLEINDNIVAILQLLIIEQLLKATNTERNVCLHLIRLLFQPQIIVSAVSKLIKTEGVFAIEDRNTFL